MVRSVSLAQYQFCRNAVRGILKGLDQFLLEVPLVAYEYEPGVREPRAERTLHPQMRCPDGTCIREAPG